MAAPGRAVPVADAAPRDARAALARHFPRLPALTPVVHVLETEQALRNVGVAVAAGADGVWLISHGRVSAAELLRSTAAAVRAAHPTLFLGVNCLSWGPQRVFAEVEALPFRVDGVWCDTMGVCTPAQWREESEEAATRGEGPLAQAELEAYAAAPQPRAEEFRAARAGWTQPDGLCFGGISFKYVDEDAARPVAEEQALLDVGARFCDVLTTSGAGTGRSARADKARLLRANARGLPTALASGVALDNVVEFRGCVDVYLAASSIQLGDDFHELDPEKTAALCARIHSFRGGGEGASKRRKRGSKQHV